MPGRVLAFTTAGELVSLAEARARPLDVAAANWVASALAVAALHPDALLLDVGSTTADVIPIADGRVAAEGRTDLDRLLAGELVYTGALRTNLAAIAPRVPVRGRWCPVASELFAISARRAPDPRAPGARGLHVPDAGRAGGERRVRARARRAARLRRHGAALSRPRSRRSPRISTASRSARSRRRRGGCSARIAAPVVPLGVGAFLARAVAERLGRPVLELPWSAAERDAAPAAALAELAAAHCARRADRRQGRRRAREGGRRRRAAGAVHRDRGGGRAPSAARRAGRRGVRGRGPRARPPLRPARGRPRTGWRSWRWTSSAGRSPTSSRARRAAWTLGARARRCRLGPAAGRAARGARPAPRVLGRHLGLDRRVGGRRRRRRAPRAAEAGRGPLPRPGRRTASRSRGSRSTSSPRCSPRESTSTCPPRCGTAGVETWVIDGRDPARLVELLDEGRTTGTLVTRS